MVERGRRHYVWMVVRSGWLYFFRRADCGGLVRRSYDRISGGYDEVWTGHMRGLTEGLIDRMGVRAGDVCVDLTCGTGYATGLLAARAGRVVVGVDSSAGMLREARERHGECEFVEADVLEYLRGAAAGSVDVVTCCWGLGYSRPFAVLREVRRVLRRGGKVGVIDNSLFSLREILYCSFLTFAEEPAALRNLMRFRFLAGAWVLRWLMRFAGFGVLHSADGSRGYMVGSGAEAVGRLRATGAAAGFEYACGEEDEEGIFERFGEIIEEKYMGAGGIEVRHRYLEGIGRKW